MGPTTLSTIGQSESGHLGQSVALVLEALTSRTPSPATAPRIRFFDVSLPGVHRSELQQSIYDVAYQLRDETPGVPFVRIEPDFRNTDVPATAVEGCPAAAASCHSGVGRDPGRTVDTLLRDEPADHPVDLRRGTPRSWRRPVSAQRTIFRPAFAFVFVGIPPFRLRCRPPEPGRVPVAATEGHSGTQKVP